MYRTIRLNPLWNWSREDTFKWIEKKRKDFIKFRGVPGDDEGVVEESDEESDQ